MRKLRPVHPGSVLRDELEERGISINRLARDIRVNVSRVGSIVAGERAITADTAMRLARYFRTSAKKWMNLQIAYDLEVAERRDGKLIKREVNLAA